MKYSSITFIIIYCITFSSCFKSAPHGEDTSIDHHLYDSLLQLYVNDQGLVDYAGFKKDEIVFDEYLKTLENNPPSSSWSDEMKLAYWINLYNAFTIKLILQEKPHNSIKDISTVSIPYVNSPWQIKLIKIKNKEYDLDDIEHGIIRKEFDEPRIHFALVCAARSCPKLRQEAYTEEKLDEQLTDQAQSFLADSLKNEIHPNHVRLSKIFSWYEKDFTKHGTLIDYLNQYTSVHIQEDAEINFMEYDWRLNGNEKITF